MNAPRALKEPLCCRNSSLNTSLTVANGYVSGDDVSVNRTAVFNDKNVAYDVNNNVTSVGISVSGVSLGGSDAGNYSVASTGSTSARITPRPLTAVLVGNIQKTYDGNTDAVLTSANYSLSGFAIVGGVSENATVNQPEGVYNSRQVLQANAVTATLTSSNFNPATGTVSILGTPVQQNTLLTAQLTDLHLGRTAERLRFVPSATRARVRAR